MFRKLLSLIRQVMQRMIPQKSIESVERVETPLSVEMVEALDLWSDMYIGKAPWLKPDTVKSLNLPAFISSELARQIVLEMKWDITGTGTDAAGEPTTNARAAFLKEEFEKCMTVLRQKLELGCAAGGVVVKPYPKGERICFDWTLDWSLYPIAFDESGNLADVVFLDTFTEGRTIYTRLERHTAQENGVRITQRAFKSNLRDSIGVEISLTDVPQWAELQPEATVQDTDGQLFGWFKVAAANNVDVDSPMGVSVFSKACDTIKEADLQYSRLLWEFEGSELAVDVDYTALRLTKDKNGKVIHESPKLNERLFRGLDTGADGLYSVFSPSIRDASLLNGLNQLMIRIEDQCGLSRGTISDPNAVARTATELNIIKQRSYATIHDNQTALERCLRDVIRVMDKYATMYHLAPAGDYDVSFEWGDGILEDSDTEYQRRWAMVVAGKLKLEKFYAWYFGCTEEQALEYIPQQPTYPPVE